MPCTTILVGKEASNDHSTMIARTDDGFFDVKKMIVVHPEMQPRHYKSVNSHIEIELPDNPMSYTASPNVDKSEGIWAATGINEENIGMTATETISSNPRVLGADPLVELREAAEGEEEIPGGIGEEDYVTLVLPYIHSAREGVLRLASLIEKYGSYESNGIAFNDQNEVWWMETIGGHHWLAQRVRDHEVIINPNQFGMDRFDFTDAFGEKKEYLCSSDMIEFIEENYLNLNKNGVFNPRNVFGSHTMHDHIYNTPRAWYMGRCLTPMSHKWDGDDAEYTPESDNIPWALIPDHKVTVEDVKYILSSHFEGTPYDPYSRHDSDKRGIYRSIGINRTGVTSICQIRNNVPYEIQAIEWICFASTTFDAIIPIYTNVDKLPAYLTDVSTDVSTENFYWTSRLINALADASYSTSIMHIERYQNKVLTRARQIIREYDHKIIFSGDYSLITKANDAICDMAKEESVKILNKLMMEASIHMKNGYNRADN